VAVLDLDDAAPATAWRAAVAALGPEVEVVVLAEPGGASRRDPSAVAAALGAADARVTLAPVTDAIKEVDPGPPEMVLDDVDRGRLRCASRPVVVRRSALADVLDDDGLAPGTSPAGAGGHPVRRLAVAGRDVRPLDGSGPNGLDTPG
jgi:hypothetical protein